MTDPGSSRPKVSGIACAVRRSRGTVGTAESSLILDRLIVISKVFAEVGTSPEEISKI